MSKPIATPGADGAKVESLLSKVRAQGSEAIYNLAKDLAHEALSNHAQSAQPKHIVTLADELAKATSTANMLGRAKVRNRFNKFTSFSEASDFSFFNEGEAIHPMSPRSALAYWQKLIPMRQIDPGAFEATQEGQAFNIAATTNQNLLKKIWDVIARSLGTGKVKGSPKEIEGILQQAGIHPKKGYSETVFRTNTMEAYRHGAFSEFSDPALDTLFPVYQYIGIHDGRERKEHGKRFNKFFSRDVPFEMARGGLKSDPFNCRCDFIPIRDTEWEQLMRKGVKLTDPLSLR